MAAPLLQARRGALRCRWRRLWLAEHGRRHI